MSAIPPTTDDHETSDEVWAPPSTREPTPRERVTSSRFEYAFGRWFATLVEPEFVLA